MARIAHVLSENFFSIRAILASFQSWRYKWLIWWQWESNRCLPGGICCIKHRAVDVICADRGWLSSVTQIAGCCMCFCVFTYYVSIYSLLYKKHGDDVFQTPRIMEGKTDSRLSGEMLLQGAETSIDNVERVSAACLSMLVDRAV